METRTTVANRQAFIQTLYFILLKIDSKAYKKSSLVAIEVYRFLNNVKGTKMSVQLALNVLIENVYRSNLDKQL